MRDLLPNVLLALLTIGVLAPLFFTPPEVHSADMLDPTWLMLLSDDAIRGSLFGRDTVFTYGPLAPYVVPHAAFTPEMWTASLVGNASRALVFAVGVALLAIRVRPRAMGALVSLVALAVFPHMGDTSFVVLVAVYALLLAEALLADGRAGARRALLAFVYALPLAGAALCKFSVTVQVGASVGLVLAALLARRDVRGLAIGAACVPLCFVFGWLATGQELALLPAYFAGSLEIARGYNDAASIAGEGSQLAWMLAQLAVFGVLLCTAWRWRLRELVSVGILVLAAGVAWKSGAVRQDGGHEVTCFVSLAILSVLALGIGGHEERSSGLRRLRVAGALLGAGIGVLGVARADVEELSSGERARLAAGALESVLDPAAARAERARTLALQRALVDLPRVRTRVGEASIDCLSARTGILLLQRMQVRHRPVFQSYSAYTPYLQRLNAEFFASERAPSYLLVEVGTIDGRWPLVDDGLAWIEVFRRYDPVMVEGGFALLRRVEDARVVPEPAQEGEVLEIELGQRVALDRAGKRLRTLALDVRRSALGALRAMVYDAPRLYLELEFRDGSRGRYRISPSGARAPFLVEPVVRTTAEFVRAYARAPSSAETRQGLRAFTVLAEEGHEKCFERGLRATLRESPALERMVVVDGAESADDVDAVLDVWASQVPHPILSLDDDMPVAGSAALRRERTDIGLVTQAEPPAELRVRVEPGRYELRMDYGILPEAWESSDGAGFVVERIAGGEERELFRRLVDPSKAEDRRMLTDAAVLGFEERVWIRFRTDAGPSGDARGDKAFWKRISIHRVR